MLPFKPQAIEQLKARYPAISRRVFDCTLGVPRPRPGELYSHLFDCEDGLRLIVSYDREKDTTYLHVSASPHTSGMRTRFKFSGTEGQSEFLDLALRRFAEISGDTKPLLFYGFSERGVPHWRRKRSKHETS